MTADYFGCGPAQTRKIAALTALLALVLSSPSRRLSDPF